MIIQIDHLFNHPQHIRLVAEWIYNGFWTEAEGYHVDTFDGLLRQANDPDRIPLSLLALMDGQPAGTVNLIDNDDPSRPYLHPWLAALVVVPQYRQLGIGSALVQCLLQETNRLGYHELYLMTDIPAFYARLGAEHCEEADEALCIMRHQLDTSDRQETDC